jgi:uncharacterized protein YyaL (SSP411 family)
MTKENDRQRYLAICRKGLAWARDRDYTGYCKFDALNSPILKAVAGTSRLRRAGFIYLVSRSPVNIRPFVGVKKGQNPNGLALFAETCFNLYKMTGEPEYLDEGRRLLSLLLAISKRTKYAGHCWGYDFDWENGVFFVPKYEPNTVVTVFVARAFLHAYSITGDTEYLGVARSSTDFLMTDLKVTYSDATMKSYSYTPFDTFTALNTNALMAGLFAAVGAVKGNARLDEETRMLGNYLLARQGTDGSWFHADPPTSSHRKVDNYHMAFMLESLLSMYEATHNESFGQSYHRGLEFYDKNLFLPSGAPKFQSHQMYPHDIVACSQGIIVFAHAARFDSAWMGRAQNIAQWTIENMLDPSGRFYFQKGKWFTNRYTLMRWCQAWMCFALSELCGVLDKGENK